MSAKRCGEALSSAGACFIFSELKAIKTEGVAVVLHELVNIADFIRLPDYLVAYLKMHRSYNAGVANVGISTFVAINTAAVQLHEVRLDLDGNDLNALLFYGKSVGLWIRPIGVITDS